MTEFTCQKECFCCEEHNVLLDTGFNEMRAEKGVWTGVYRGGQNIVLFNSSHCSLPGWDGKSREQEYTDLVLSHSYLWFYIYL